ncbi:MAG: LPS assembly protein LptD [Gammaproteobacteria bacterium]|nr:LPS assembly protein LptD [Gammaproteobacteria bacterium]
MVQVSQAADLSCDWSSVTDIDSLESDGDAIDDQRLHLYADQASLSDTEGSLMSGNIRFRSGESQIEADELFFDPADGSIDVRGDVRLVTPNMSISGSEATFYNQQNLEDLSGNFLTAEVTLPELPARSRAGRISNPDKNTLVLEDVTYTTCPPGSNDWALVAPNITLDRAQGYGVGRHVWLKFMKVPILYTPYITFPIDDRRRSGFLTSDFGSDDRSGFEFGQPYYWNLAPNYDLVTIPRYLEKRGAKLDSTFRYLTGRSHGEFSSEYLPDDRIAERDRGIARWVHTTQWSRNWRLQADVTELTDNDYLQDFSGSLVDSSPTHIDRQVNLSYRNQYVQMRTRVQDFITLDDSIPDSEQPYERLPQIELRTRLPIGRSGFEVGLDQEWVQFDRSTGITGSRWDLTPWMRWRYAKPSWSLTPEISLRHTNYSVDNTTGDDHPTRTVPIFSIDGELFLERPFGKSGRFRQTLEPRIRYTHIPFRDQNDLPVFDSGAPDFNFVQLFADNRFTGADRIGDTDKLSVALSSRVINQDTGKNMLTATLGHAWFLSDRTVGLPTATSGFSDDQSNLIAEIQVPIGNRWSGELEHQWNTEEDRTAKSAIKLQYRPDEKRVMNFGYRFREDDLEQTDLSFAWPVADRWSVVGRWNYSLREEATLERFAGLEYQTCCWKFRLVGRKFVTDTEGRTEDAIFAQLELNGLFSVGGHVSNFLERGVLGYETD